MLTVIMAGGKGTRILEETQFKPKAMVNIGNKPIIEHIMDSYKQQGFKDFLILSGYKGNYISEYFKLKPNVVSCKEDDKCIAVKLPDSNVTILDTGEETGSGARLRLAKDYIAGNCFMLTYCDGLCSVDFNELISYHNKHEGIVTLTAVRPKPRFGILDIAEDGIVNSLKEKDYTDSPYINGGFMVIDSDIFNEITEDMEQLEKDLLVSLSKKRMLMAYKHDGFWQCMDTLQEKNYLCSLMEQDLVPWINIEKDK